jgi:hypothetical protein
MSLPTAEEVTNLYLYGQKTTPSDLLSDQLIRNATLITPFEVNVNEYMAGPGRFVAASDFDVVKHLGEHSLCDHGWREV